MLTSFLPVIVKLQLGFKNTFLRYPEKPQAVTPGKPVSVGLSPHACACEPVCVWPPASCLWGVRELISDLAFAAFCLPEVCVLLSGLQLRPLCRASDLQMCLFSRHLGSLETPQMSIPQDPDLAESPHRHWLHKANTPCFFLGGCISTGGANRKLPSLLTLPGRGSPSGPPPTTPLTIQSTCSRPQQNLITPPLSLKEPLLVAHRQEANILFVWSTDPSLPASCLTAWSPAPRASSQFLEKATSSLWTPGHPSRWAGGGSQGGTLLPGLSVLL